MGIPRWEVLVAMDRWHRSCASLPMLTRPCKRETKQIRCEILVLMVTCDLLVHQRWLLRNTRARRMPTINSTSKNKSVQQVGRVRRSSPPLNTRHCLAMTWGFLPSPTADEPLSDCAAIVSTCQSVHVSSPSKASCPEEVRQLRINGLVIVQSIVARCIAVGRGRTHHGRP